MIDFSMFVNEAICVLPLQKTIRNILSYWFYVDYTNIPLKGYLYLNST